MPPSLEQEGKPHFSEHAVYQERMQYLSQLELGLERGHLSEILSYTNFVLYKKRPRENGTIEKVPFDPKNPKRPANPHDPNTWGKIDQALAQMSSGRYDGIGFELGNSPFGAIDWDEKTPQVLEEMQKLPSYGEWSPSKRGPHVLGIFTNPGPNINRSVEMYSDGYITLTANWIPTSPLAISNIQTEASELYWKYAKLPQKSGAKQKKLAAEGVIFQGESIVTAFNTEPEKSDEEVLEILKKKPIVWLYYSGAPEATAVPTRWCPTMSDVVWRLLLYLKTETNGNPGQMDRLFRQSGLFPLYKDKWDRKNGEYTIGATNIYKLLTSEAPPSSKK